MISIIYHGISVYAQEKYSPKVKFFAKIDRTFLQVSGHLYPIVLTFVLQTSLYLSLVFMTLASIS